MLNIDEYRQIRKDYFGESFEEASDGFCKYKIHMLRNSLLDFTEYFTGREMSEFQKKAYKLAPLPKAVPVPQVLDLEIYCKYQEGKTPMRYNDNYASASANVNVIKSDVADQRAYFSDRLQSALYPKQKELQELFNLYVDNTPKTYKEMIDIIKTGKYTIDPKIAKKVDAFDVSEDGNDLSDFHYGPLYGIIFDGPQRDPEGYHQAYEEMKKQKTAAQDTIIAGDAAAGLKALQDFEAWLPTPAVTTTTA